MFIIGVVECEPAVSPQAAGCLAPDGVVLRRLRCTRIGVAPGVERALIGKVLGDEVAEVRASRRLTDSASCLVIGEHEMALHMRHLLEQAGQSLPDSRPSLEVNLEHPLLARMERTVPEAQQAAAAGR